MHSSPNLCNQHRNEMTLTPTSCPSCVCSYRWAQTRIIPPPALLHKIGTRFENALRWAVERADSDLVPLPGPDSATSREVVSLCSNYLQLSVVSDSLLEALELWLLRCAQTLSSYRM